MKFVRITLVQPPETRHPMQGFLEASDEVHHERLLAWTVLPDAEEWYVLFHVDGDPSAYDRAIDAVPEVLDYDLTTAGEGSFYAYIVHERRQEDVEFLTPFAERNLVVVPPVEYTSDGETRLTLVGAPADLQGLVDDLPGRILVDVDRIGEYDHRRGAIAGRLTDRQREAVRAAVDLGFYETPREATLADVAAELDCASSTASTLLNRAESAVMGAVVERPGGG